MGAWWVWCQNWMVSGALMPTPNPSMVGLRANLLTAFESVFGTYLPGGGVASHVQIALLGAGLVILGVLLVARRQLSATVRDVLIVEKRYILALWAFLYLA